MMGVVIVLVFLVFLVSVVLILVGLFSRCCMFLVIGDRCDMVRFVSVGLNVLKFLLLNFDRICLLVWFVKVV